MRRLLPASPDEVDVLEAYAAPTDRPWLRANMVTSLDGSAVVDGRSHALGGEGDALVFAALRGLADMVLVGAGTARTEGYRALRPRPAYAGTRSRRGQSPAPTLAVVTRRVDLDPSSELFSGPDRTVVVTCGASADLAESRLGAVADLVIAGESVVDIGVALDQLAGRGLRQVLCEGGPHLLGELVNADRLDELCLTISPHLVGGQGPRILAAAALPGPPVLALTQLLEHDGALLARYSRP